MTEQQMSENSSRIKEILKTTPAIIAISGPSGAGKDYLTQAAMKHFESEGVPTFNVQMTTERPHRGIEETKKCVSPQEYDKLVAEGKLVGDHVNKVRYGFQMDDLKNALDEAKSKGGMVILELNPVKQAEFPSQLKEKLGIDLTAWIGVETTEEQTRLNMINRGETEQTIKERLQTMHEFVEAMDHNPGITICNNGPDNRQNSAGDFVKIIESAILDTK